MGLLFLVVCLRESISSYASQIVPPKNKVDRFFLFVLHKRLRWNGITWMIDGAVTSEVVLG